MDDQVNGSLYNRRFRVQANLNRLTTSVTFFRLFPTSLPQRRKLSDQLLSKLHQTQPFQAHQLIIFVFIRDINICLYL